MYWFNVKKKVITIKTLLHSHQYSLRPCGISAMLVASPMPTKVPSVWSLGLEPKTSNSNSLVKQRMVTSLKCNLIKLVIPKDLISSIGAKIHSEIARQNALLDQWPFLFLFLNSTIEFSSFFCLARTCLLAEKTLCLNYMIVMFFFIIKYAL